jgi:DNA polymerase I-like protein with 3'-5' exonuclease and polymerase domains
MDKDRVHPSYNVLVSTGRTSCYNPNIQQIPREGGIRECFIPSPGHCFVIIDYSTLELCTLAQVCLDRYGSSRMAELINKGADLHRWFASVVANKRETEVTEEERQRAKACNFGFPGGLGAARFLEYARNTFGITDMAEQKAAALKEKWLDAFPEMRLYLQDCLLERHDFSSLDWCDDSKIAANLFKRIIGGSRTSTTGKPYSPKTIQWAFEVVLPDVAPWAADATEGSKQLLAEVVKETVVTRTGRIRAKVDYCQAKNTPFQGLAADGAKIALYRLVKAGYRIALFVHDEFVVEIPTDCDLGAEAKKIEDLVVNGMRSVVPDVVIRAEWAVADRWYKKVKVIRDADGKIGIFSAPVASASVTGMEQRL